MQLIRSQSRTPQDTQDVCTHPGSTTLTLPWLASASSTFVSDAAPTLDRFVSTIVSVSFAVRARKAGSCTSGRPVSTPCHGSASATAANGKPHH